VKLKKFNYNKFRIGAGRLIGVILIVFAKNFNFYALLVIATGILIRLWASGYIHKDREVTIAGPYHAVRHPLYLGNFITGLGFALFINVWQLVVLYIPTFLIIYYKKMKLEEEYLLNKFGEQYQEYQRTTGMFIPDVTKLFYKGNCKFSWRCYFHNNEHLNLLGSISIIALSLVYHSIFNK
jgi:protein-S-isoprenylcysteine O-methyltransferase Ste14